MYEIDERYVESAAYHEAGHVVVAAVLGLSLRPEGIRINRFGGGHASYCCKKPDGSRDVGADVQREQTIVATMAGYIAQSKFYIDGCHPQCPPSGGCFDIDDVIALLNEMYSDRDAWYEAKAKLGARSEHTVEQYWDAIEGVALKL